METTTNTQRDELAREIWLADRLRACAPGGPSEQDYRAADRLIAKDYRKPRIVTTVEELDALPVGSVVMDADAYVGRKERDTGGAEWSVSLHKYSKESRAFTLPATVLHTPETEK